MATVLVVEDDRALLTVLQRILTRAGYDVVVAHTGRAGLQHARRSHIDALLVDLRLPDIGGLDVAQRFLTERRAAVVMMTAYGTVATAVAAMKLGACDYLEKPFSRMDLLRTITAALATALARAAPADAATSLSHHPSAAWARLVLDALSAHDDPRTLQAWARCAHASPGTIKRRCAALGLTAKQSRDFARLLRAFMYARHYKLPVSTSLDADPRTLNHLMRRGGFDEIAVAQDEYHQRPTSAATELPTLDEFLARQRFVTDSSALAAVQALARTYQDRKPVD